MSRFKDDETKITDQLIARALGAGWAVTVNDGEETVLRRSTSVAAINEAMRSTEEDYLTFTGVDGARLGWVRLIYGNGEDLISDYAYNGPMDGLVKRVEQNLGW